MSATESLDQKLLGQALVEGMRILKQTGAASLKYTISDDKDRPLASLIIVSGREESADFLEALKEVEEQWNP